MFVFQQTLRLFFFYISYLNMLLIDVVPKVGEFPEAVGTNLFLLLLHVRSQMLPLLTVAS